MNRKILEIEQTLAKLNAGSTRSYRLWPVPGFLDQAISEMVLSFSELSEVERTQVRQKITTLRSSWMLLTYAERMFQLGVQEESEVALFKAALALLIEDFREVTTESFVLLSLLVEEIEKIVPEPDQFWAEVSRLATPKTARFIEQALKTASRPALSFRELVA